MVDDAPARDDTEWNSPEQCPFCGAPLTDGGSGFIDHIDATPGCRERFESWIDRVRDDIEGEWIG